ncbi:MAG: PEP-CTERM sorting domain-containing protein [Isosphaeraceae bacterium]
MRKHLAYPLLAAAVFLGLSLTPARAGFIVLSGNNPEPDEQNVLLNNDQVGLTISGTTNQSGDVVNFTSPSQFLVAPSNGQARVEARESDDIDSDQVAIDAAITVAFASPSIFFRDLIFNAFIGGGIGEDGTLEITLNGLDADGNVVSETFTTDSDDNPLTLANGSNFYTVLATDGWLLTSVEITPTQGSYADLRQIRISGVGAIPEPSSIVLSAIGLAGVGIVAVRRRSLGRSAI